MNRFIPKKPNTAPSNTVKAISLMSIISPIYITEQSKKASMKKEEQMEHLLESLWSVFDDSEGKVPIEALEEIVDYFDEKIETSNGETEDVIEALSELVESLDETFSSFEEKLNERLNKNILAIKNVEDLQRNTVESLSETIKDSYEKSKQRLEFTNKDLNTQKILLREVSNGHVTFENKFEEKLDKVKRSISERYEDGELRKSLKQEVDELRQVIFSIGNQSHYRGGGGNANRNEWFNSNPSILSPYTDINWIAGTGITIIPTSNNTRKTTDVTITATGAGGGGTTTETPVGVVNGINTVFTVTAEPRWVVSDGVTYYTGVGYAYAALSITMDIAPSSFIRAQIPV